MSSCCRHTSRYSGHRAGFSLLELIITISFLSVVTFSFVISYHALYASIARTSDIQAITADLLQARLRARTTGRPVAILFSGTEYLICEEGAPAIVRKTAFTFDGKTTMTYSPNGLPYHPATLRLHTDRGRDRKIVISGMGRVRCE